jgi:hypothetical protein
MSRTNVVKVDTERYPARGQFSNVRRCPHPG